jgi:tetratricopeptide (TPR) repeat protein
MQGDAYYLLHDNRNAKKAYLKFLRYLPKNAKRDFIYGWANYRIGLLSNNAKKAVAYFKKSSFIFNQFRYEDLCARSEGERGVRFVQLREPYKFVRIVEWMAKKYFLRKRMKIGPAVMVGLAQLIRIQSILNNTPLLESDEKVYPEFNRRVYAGVSIEAKPQGSGIIAFYSLANTYSALGCSERKIKSLRIALSFKPTNSIDFNSKVFVCNELLMEIVQLGSIEEIFNIIIDVILIEPTKVRSGLQNLSSCAFRAIDKNISFLKDSRKYDLLKLCSKIEDHLTKLQYTNLDWWLAEIYLIKAKLSLDILDRNQQYSYWSKAYKHGINSSNVNVIIESAHSISFIYPDFSESIISVAEKQFSIVKGISTQDCNYERLEGIGINLFNGWSNLDWRRESTYDLRAKYALMDGAKKLKEANFSDHQASPIMILLLCSVFDFKNKVSEWASNMIQKEKISNIPNFVRDKIKGYL